MAQLLRTSPEDRYFDYCLEPYEPRTSPVGKLRSENMLWKMLDIGGASPRLREAIRTISDGVGRDLTVWGAKLDPDTPGGFRYELYYYDPKKEDVRATVSSVRDLARPYFDLAPPVPESTPYFMFSFEPSDVALERRRVERVSVYLPAYERHAGTSYEWFGDGRRELENVYEFLHPKLAIREILHGVRTSARVDYDRVGLEEVLPPELFTCRRICVAKKRFADAIYFSGIHVDQLLFFLRRHGYPAELVDFVQDHRGELDHLLSDVGVDYTMNDDGQLAIVKTGFYGTI